MAPELARKRRPPAWLVEGTGKAFHHSTPEALYRQEFFGVVDLATSTIKDRFDQPGYQTIASLEKLLSAASGRLPDKDCVDFVIEHARDDVSKSSLFTQLELLGTAMPSCDHSSITDVRDRFLLSLSPPQRYNFSEVCTLLKIILVSPATNAVSERSASALVRVKTYLRSTMSQERLTSLLLLHYHKARTDDLQLQACLQEFVETREHRRNVFGRFDK